MFTKTTASGVDIVRPLPNWIKGIHIQTENATAKKLIKTSKSTMKYIANLSNYIYASNATSHTL